MPIVTAYFFTDETEQIGGGPYLTMQDAGEASVLYGRWLSNPTLMAEAARKRTVEINRRAQDLRAALVAYFRSCDCEDT